MSALSDAIDTLKGDNAQLASEVDGLIGVVSGIPAVVADAVTKALADAGVGDDAAVAALADIDAAVKAETAKAHDILNPPAPPAADAGAPPPDAPPADATT